LQEQELRAALSRLRLGKWDWGAGMVAELVFYVLTALLFSVGMWFAANLLF
jgi:hypothetical protein